MGIQENRLYTVQEVAGIMRVSPATVYRMIEYYEIKTTKVGKQHRIWGKDIIDYLQKRAINE